MGKKEAINDLLEDIFEIYGIPHETKNNVLITEKKREKYPIILKENSVNYNTLDGLIDKFGGKFLVISLSGFSRGAKALAEETGIDLWDKNKLEKEIGKAVLSEVGVENRLDLNNPNNLDLIERETQKEPSFSKNDFSVREQKNKKSKTKQNSKLKNDFFPLKISKEDAIKKSNIKNPKIHILKFNPYFEIEYSCNSTLSYREEEYEIKEEGKIYLNAIDGEISDFNIAETTSSIEAKNVSFDKKEKKYNKKEATQKALKKIRRKLSIEKNIGENRKESIVFEKKELKPNKEDIEIINNGLIYRPIWDVRNSKQSTQIDGVNGSIVSGSTEEGVEFL